MKKLKFFTPWNVEYKVFNPEYHPSKTVPDDAMTIQEILDRVSHGLTTGLDAAVGYGDDDDADDLETGWDDPTLEPDFDKLDALEMFAGEDAQKTRKEIKEAIDKLKKKKKDQAFEDEVERRIKERTSKDKDPGQ